MLTFLKCFLLKKYHHIFVVLIMFTGQIYCEEPGVNFQSNFLPEETKTRIKNWYYLGEFEMVNSVLDSCLRNSGLGRQEDSVFAFKYMGIIYSSDKNTRVKGEGLLFTMVKLKPDIDMRDMHLSADLEDLFIKVRDRYFREHPDARPLPMEAARPVKDTIFIVDTKPKPNETSWANKKWMWWAVGGTAAGVITYLVISSGDEKDKKTEIHTGKI